MARHSKRGQAFMADIAQVYARKSNAKNNIGVCGECYVIHEMNFASDTLTYTNALGKKSIWRFFGQILMCDKQFARSNEKWNEVSFGLEFLGNVNCVPVV